MEKEYKSGEKYQIELGSDEVFMKNLNLENLPNCQLNTKLQIISFCFLLLGVPEENSKPQISYSRITDKFWNKLRNLTHFHKTFDKFSDKELANTYKYIFYFPCSSKYSHIFLIKSYFSLFKRDLITDSTLMSQISRSISNCIANENNDKFFKLVTLSDAKIQKIRFSKRNNSEFLIPVSLKSLYTGKDTGSNHLLLRTRKIQKTACSKEIYFE